MNVKIKIFITIYALLLLKTAMAEAQPKLFRNSNLLLPSDFLVSYVVHLQKNPYFLKGYKTDVNGHQLTGEYPSTDLANFFIQRVLSGESPAYSFNDGRPYFPYDVLENRQELTTEEIQNKIYGAWGYEDTLIRYGTLSELKAFEFIEKWSYNPGDFNFTKDVIAVNPIRVSLEPQRGIVNRRTFYVFNLPNSQNYKSTAKKCLLKIAYEFYMDKQYCDNRKKQFADGGIPFRDGFQMWNNNSWFAFMESILSSVTNEQKEAFDYYSNQKLTTEEIKFMLGVTTYKSTIIYENGNVGDWESERSYNLNDFKSILFLEEWYLTDNQELKKKVIAVSPVYYLPEEKDGETEYIKKMTFWVYL